MKINAHIPTQQEIKELLDYDSSTGFFRWENRMSHAVKAGDIAGSVKAKDGYRRIKVFGKYWYAHQLAWLYVYGSLPEKELDHKDGGPDNNSITNLRQVNRSHNMRNRKVCANSITGFTGVTKRKDGGYTARIMIDSKPLALGYYKDIQDAVNIRRNAEIEFEFISRRMP